MLIKCLLNKKVRPEGELTYFIAYIFIWHLSNESYTQVIYTI